MAQAKKIWEVEVSKFNHADNSQVLLVRDNLFTSRKKAIERVKFIASIYRGVDIHWDFVAEDYIACDFTDKDGNYRVYTIKSELVF